MTNNSYKSCGGEQIKNETYFKGGGERVDLLQLPDGERWFHIYHAFLDQHHDQGDTSHYPHSHNEVRNEEV